MKRVVVLLLPLTAACASLGAGPEKGASSPESAIEIFLVAANRQDVTVMSSVWGTEKGPTSKSATFKLLDWGHARRVRRDLERRELIMMMCLGHEKAVIGSSSPGEAGRRKITVQLSAANRTASPTFTAVQGPQNRWFVENFDLDQLSSKGFCRAKPAQPRP